MASNIPAQLRAVDPYASYNSNVVNQLTGIVTRGSNVLDYYNSLQVIPDSTSPLTVVEVQPGIVFKDDMLIEITSAHRVDFEDLNQYVSASGSPFSAETGIYYVVLEYTYTKSRPAPQARIKILLPSQRSTFNAGNIPSLFFLKAVEVEVVNEIKELYDYDPENTSTQREYVRNYASSDAILPTFEQMRDQARLSYVSTENEFYFGYEDEWQNVGSGGAKFEADTSSFDLGDLVYVTTGGSLSKAISTLSIYTADGVVAKVGTKGFVQTVGKVSNVPVEPGSEVLTGNLLYLSGSNPGTITKNQTSPFSQFVGRCTAVDGTSADILFVRGAPEGTPSANLSKFQYTAMDTTAGWVWDAGEGLYYQDIDITTFEGKDVVVDLFDPGAFNRRFEPTNLEFVSDEVLRVWMPINTKNPEACILGRSEFTIGSSDVATVTATLNPGGWILAGSGRYYQDIDVSNLQDGKGVVTVHDKITQEVIEPTYVYFWDSTTISVAMLDNLSTLDVTIIGDSNVGTSSNITFSTILAAGGSWNPSGGKFYQDIEIGELGLDTEALVIGSRDFDTDMKVIPDTIHFIEETIIRVWMPIDTVNLVVTING